MHLNELKVKNAKPQEKLYRLFDGRGLYLEVNPKGGKYWRFKYRFEDRERRMGFGVYPDISLSQARERREEARKLVANGVDPAEIKKAEKVSRAGGDSFEVVAREWHAKHLHTWTPKHGEAILKRLSQNIFPWLGAEPVEKITSPELLKVLRRMESRGAVETTHRVRSTCSQIFRYAIATGRLERDPANDLVGAIPPTRKAHFPTLTDPKEIAGLLRAMDTYEGSLEVRCALQLAPMLFVRPGELRHAEWSEIDWEKKEWRIPAQKMKMRVQHIVPLSKQALAILKVLKPLTGHGEAAKYLFPSVRTLARPMSDNTLNSALRRMGFEKDMIVAHGFRAMASTLLNEQGWNRDAIERQLAHGEKNKVRAAYNHAEYLPERRKMMQAWADYLDKLKEG
ncbi:MAG: integrase [Alphaproteobacteria bacterium CG_4_10_14_0_8_um_filter_53_9]|nr:MAG: integrase [Alphaproteobacteria bacterium CG_4_10_14_0_8_um_filter_53_9]